MKRARQASIIGSLALITLAAAAVLFFFPKEQAKAQFGQALTEGSSESVTYSASYINRIVPSRTDDRVQKVTPFPNTPVFFVELKSTLNVWLRKENGLRLLREIKLEDDLQELVFLDDNRTFIVQANESVRVFSIDRDYSEVEAEEEE